jgi:hypothetical protein
MLIAQQGSTSAKPAQPEIPSHILSFSAPKILTNVGASPFMVNPMQCSPDGRAFVEMVPNGDVLHQSLYSVSSSGEVVSFDRTKAPGLRDVQVISDFPGERDVVSLVLAKKDSVGGVASDGGSDEGTPERAYYLIVQDQKGQIKKVIELKIRIKPVQVALLSSGNFLVFGIEPINQIPELELLDTDGSLIRILDVEGTKYGGSRSIAKVFGEQRADLSTVLSWAHFVPYQDDVLLYQGGSKLPVFVIGDSGILQSVQISHPLNMQLDSIVPMSSGWLVRMRDTEDLHRLAGQQVVYEKASSLYQVNPDTGEVVLALVPPSNITSNEIACAVNNKLLALHPIYPDGKDTNAPPLGLFTGAF